MQTGQQNYFGNVDALRLPGTTGAYVFELATVEALRISRGGAA